MRALEVLEDEVEGGQALLAVHELPRTVISILHHDRLQVVGRSVAVSNVVEEPTDLVLSPPVAALVRGNEEVTGDVADRHDPERSGVHHQTAPSHAIKITRDIRLTPFGQVVRGVYRVKRLSLGSRDATTRLGCVQ